MPGGNNMEIAILAAGGSTRFQGIKALAPYGGTSLIERAIANSLGHPRTLVSVVLGAYADKITESTRLEKTRLLYNPAWQEGMATSIQCSLRNLESDTNAVLFLAVDQVLVTHGDIRNMIDSYRRNGEKIIAAHYRNQTGIPAIFPVSYVPRLMQLKGDKGAKALLRDNPDVILFPLPAAATDIDTRKDLDVLSAALPSGT